jgi:Cu+-exporting ATPase
MTPTTTLTTDPVCHMTVDPAKAAGASTFGGETYYFCSSSCEAKFDATPEVFTSGKGEAVSSCCSTGSCC